jgi:hypothetical protein
MTPGATACLSPCCGGAPAARISDYIDRGLRRRRAPPLPVRGETRWADDGRFARFSLRMERDVIADVSFDASTCATLVAYCELAAERVAGLDLHAAVRRICARDLADAMTTVPVAKRGLALLVSQALMGAIVRAAMEGSA